MNKESFLTLALTLATIPALAVAQPVIHPRDIPSQPGLAPAYWTASDTQNGIQVDVGEAGEDRVWDFTAYELEDVTFDSLLDPDAAPERETFPTANRVLLSAVNDLGLNLGTGYQYETLTDSGWFMLGVASDGGIFNQAIVYQTPMLVLPMPAEYGAAWDIGANLDIGFPLPDSLLGLLGDLGDFADLVDSIYIRVSLGGSASLDGWGIVRFSGGEVRALRQRISTGGSISVVAVGTIPIINERFEIEIPGLGYDLQVSQTYRWFAAGVGEIASMTSMLGDDDPNFSLAAQVRVRRIIPAMEFPDAPLVFGEVHVGNSGLASLSFGNTGEGIGIITRIGFSGGLENEIEVLTELPYVIEPDSNCLIRFLWTPQQERSLDRESLLIYHNDPAASNPLMLQIEGFTPDFNDVKGEKTVAEEFSLGANYPNPFNSATRLTFGLPEPGRVLIQAYDPAGHLIGTLAEGWFEAGRHFITFDGRDLPSGVYLMTMKAGKFRSMRKTILIR
jgi:hypothetical protein